MELKKDDLNLLDDLSEPIIVILMGGGIPYYNKSFLTYSKSRPRLIKKASKISEIFEFNDYNIEKKIMECLDSEELIRTEEIRISPLTESIPLTCSIIIKPISLEGSSGCMLSFKDFSEEVNLQDKYKSNVSALKESHELLIHEHKLLLMGEMAAEMAHEINNPLAIIQGSMELLTFSLQGQNVDEDQKISYVLDAVERIKKIVKGLKDFTRGEGDDNIVFNASEKLEESCELLKTISKDDYSLVFEKKDEDAFLRGDPHKFQQVVTNLLNNAKDALEGCDKREIKSFIEVSPPNVILKVSDTGCGISKENHEKIFEGFFTTKDVGKGTGLGMGVVSTIVKNMNGKIDFNSTLGEGTEFIITFPYIPVDVELSFEEEIEGSMDIELPTLKNVLIVDDIKEILQILGKYLEETGAKIELCETVEEAKEKVDSKKYDLIITDYKIGEETGFDLAMHIKTTTENNKTPLILSSGSLSEDLRVKFRLELSLFKGTLEKPYRKERLFSLLNKVLSN